MLQILQTRHIESYTKLIDELGLSDEAVNVVEATENGEITGIGVYHMDFARGQVVIDHAQYGDILLADGIYRSILFLAVLRGTEQARFEVGEKLADDCIRLGFISRESNVLENINDILDGCKNCSNNA